MKIAIIGTRGIPNYHGGFEQFAEFFSVYARQKGHDIFVYNSHNHPFIEETFKGVRIIKCYDPEKTIGTIGQFFYDFNCIKDTRRRSFDIILQLGYTSSSVWGWLLPKKTIIVTNMDGLEWKRSKYSKGVQKFLLKAEKWAVKTSDYLISDSLGIRSYIKDKYKMDSEFIAYGACVFKPTDEAIIKSNGITSNQYFSLIARMEPENNIEVILDGYAMSNSPYPFYVIGNYENTKFGRYLRDKFKNHKKIYFLGAIYDLNFLNHLRYHSRLYFHGHSVGGTNPSLLEAMGSGALIVAHNNVFNKAILEDDAFYFKSADEVSKTILSITKDEHAGKISNNFTKIITQYSWEIINKKYLNFLNNCYHERKAK
jgi:glycosyltransferase involved in cell wall biosynthesis